MPDNAKDDYLPVSHLKQYELTRLVGRGPRSAVYVAREPQADRLVAIKLLNADLAADPRAVWRFVSQAAAAARIQHSFIAQIYFVGQDRPHWFCAREFVDGDSLGSRLAEGQNFSTDDLLEAACLILEAVATAHARGIEHGNLHAENVLFDRVQERLVLTDFQGSELSPAAAARGGTVDISRDLRSVGNLVQQMLLGFDATSVFSAGSHSISSADLVRFIERLMGKGDAPPFQSAVEALLTTRRLAREEPPAAIADLTSPDSLLRHQVPQAQTNATAIIELPVVERIPDLPADLLTAVQASQSRSWWQWLGGRGPENDSNELQETRASIQEALAEMQSRRRWLEKLATEEQAVLDSLQQQGTKNQGSRKGSMTQLGGSIEKQQRQLAEISRRQTEVGAAIQRLESQREQLEASQKAAEK